MAIDKDEIKSFQINALNRRQAIDAKQKLIEFKRTWKLNENGSVNYVFIILIIAVCLAILYIFLNFFHVDADFNKAKEAYGNSDYIKASEYLELSCNKDNSEACNALGVMYDSGKGVQVDGIKAINFYTKACKLQNKQGCLNLAQMAQTTK